MGLAWGVANVALYPLGWITNRIGIHNTTLILGLLPLLGLIFLLSPVFREERRGSC